MLNADWTQRNSGGGDGDGVAGPAPVVSDHQLLRRIGQGSYGEVWLARNVMGIYRAIKVIRRQMFREARPFERELDGIYRFEPISRSHEGFVDVLHIGKNEAAGYFYYVMELADDVERGQAIDPETYRPRTLSVELVNRGRLPFEDCARLGLSLSEALDHLHRQGLVHRDIKPANIIFVHGTPRLADIGLVSEVATACSFVGTEGYVPPEGPGRPQADIYSLGKVLYECSTGLDRTVFPRLPDGLDQSPDWAGLLEMNEITLRACHHDSAQRYASAEELHTELGLVQHGKSVRQLRTLERRLARVKQVGLWLVVAAAVLGGIGYLYNREQVFQAQQRQQQADLHLAEGLRAMEAGLYPQSLTPLVEALRLDRASDAKKDRLRIGTTLDECPRLLHLWHEADYLDYAEFSPDGHRVVLISQWGPVYIKDVETGDNVGGPLGTECFVFRGAFHPDGELLLGVAVTGEANLWDWRSRISIWSFQHPALVRGLKFSYQGDVFASACDDNVVRIWSGRTGALLNQLTNHTEGVYNVAFSHDGARLVTMGTNEYATVWNARDGQLLPESMRHKSAVYGAAFSPDDHRLVTACADNAAHVWDVAEGREALLPLKHSDWVMSAEFSPDGRLILTGSYDGTARLWDAATGLAISPNGVLPHGSRVYSAKFSPGGNCVVTACRDGSARLWDLAGGRGARPMQAAFSGDGSRHVIQENRRAQVLAEAGKVFPPIDIGSMDTPTALNENGRFFLALSRAQPGAAPSLWIWQVDTGQQICSVRPFTNELTKVLIDDQGRWLASWMSNKAQLYDLQTGRRHLAALVHPDNVRAASFNSAGSELLVTTRKDVYLWNVPTGELKQQFPHKDWVRFARLSPDGRILLTSATREQAQPYPVLIWNTGTGMQTCLPLAHQGFVICGDLSPDGRHLITGSEDFNAYIWDLGNPTAPKKLRHAERVCWVCYNQDGTRVLTLSRDWSARVWDAQTGQPLTPPWSHGLHCQRGAFLGEDRVVVYDRNEGALWRLKQELRPVEDLALLGKILGGNPVLATKNSESATAALYARWQELKGKYPETFRTTREELIGWHRRQASDATNQRQWAAAVFHYERWIGLEPNDPVPAQLRAEAMAELQREQQESDARER